MLLKYMSILFRYIITQISKISKKKRLFMNYKKAMEVLVRPNSIIDHLNYS